MKFNDFSRFKAAINRQEPNGVPLVEAVADYSMQSNFLNKKVVSSDFKIRLEY